MPNIPFGATPALQRQAATPAAGFALQNGTPTILTWNVPNDGQNHRFTLIGAQDVTVAETGGQVLCSYTLPDGFATAHTVFAAGQAQGDNVLANNFSIIVKPGTVVTVFQNTALNPGAATIWVEIWGS